MRVVAGDVLDIGLHFIQVLAEADYLPLLLLNQCDGGEDAPDDALVLPLVVLVEPEVVYHHEDPTMPPLLQHVQEGPDADEDGQALALNDALPILILGVELSTRYTVSPGHVTGFAPAITILLADPLGSKFVLHAVRGMLRILHTLDSLQAVALDASSAVVGEMAGRAFIGAAKQHFDGHGGGVEEIEFALVDEHLRDILSNMQLPGEFKGTVAVGVAGDVL